jgi:carbamoyl-phosphate synthase large subunit
MIVIEMNPRVSRSSALASKATGFPIAKVAAKLAVGYTLDELRNDITGGATPASFEPSIDYVVTKIPRFAFEKFPAADPHLTTQMKSVGEVMAMGRTFQESFQKALRGLETGIDGLSERSTDRDEIVEEIGNAGPERILFVADAFRIGMTLDEIFEETAIDPWFLAQIEDLVQTEKAPGRAPWPRSRPRSCASLKQKGFSDRRLAKLLGTHQHAVRERRQALGVRPVYKRVDTCAAEFATQTAYLYSTYDEECEAEPTTRKKIMVLGGGPNRIGQGIEFDYCCVHAALALREDGYETIMVNCNPETVSTDYDTSDRLYFEPVTLEDVLEIVDKEKPVGVIVQYGGQTPLKLALDLERAGVPIIGTTPDSIDIAEDRERFQQLLHELGLKQPPNRTARTEEQAWRWPRDRLPAGGAPELRAGRPCDGDRARRQGPGALHARGGAREREVAGAAGPLPRRRHRGRRRLHQRRHRRDDRRHHGARRAAGIHSGDSACSLPPYTLPASLQDELRRQTALMAAGAEGRGPDERAVRHPGRRRTRGRLRAGGQPARVAHRALRQQGHRPAAGQDRRALHGRPVAAVAARARLGGRRTR